MAVVLSKARVGIKKLIAVRKDLTVGVVAVPITETSGGVRGRPGQDASVCEWVAQR